LPELHAEQIRAARLVANPGCYPTATLLALAPLARTYAGRIACIAVDAKSGITGAGRTPKVSSLYAEVEGGVRPYAAGDHRHMPEIAEQLERLGLGVPFGFVPHVVPLSRGLLATCYVWFSRSTPRSDELVRLYEDTYGRHSLVQVLQPGELPETRAVARTARACIGTARIGPDLVVAACAIDNLGKGASAQALQNLNIMFGHAEESGLDALATVA